MARNSNTAKANQVETQAEVAKPITAPTQTTEKVVSNDKGENITSFDLTPYKENKSAAMRFLASKGFKIGDIARHLSVFYGQEVKFQFVRNVLMQQAPKAKG